MQLVGRKDEIKNLEWDLQKSEPQFIGVFFRMRKRHLLPALHDGMQGDEDGMQTCERPPLWAFGWPRGGVHMFTSLHVACLARVA